MSPIVYGHTLSALDVYNKGEPASRRGSPTSNIGQVVFLLVTELRRLVSVGRSWLEMISNSRVYLGSAVMRVIVVEAFHPYDYQRVDRRD